MMRDIEELITGLTADVSFVKPAPHPYLLSLKWIGAASVYLAMSLAFTGLRSDWLQAVSNPWYVVELIALCLLSISSLVSAALLSYPDLYQMRKLSTAPVWMFALFLVVLLFAWFADNPPAPLPVHNYQCTSCIVLMALLPAVWVLYAVRKFASTRARLAGLVIVLAAFGVGALWLRLHEVNDSILHIVQWHYLPMLAFSLIGFGIGKWALRW
jgi:hypothetical protein